LVENANGKFAFVTIGGENAVKVYRRGEKPELVATITTGDLPHGIWGSGDGTRVYVGLENQDAVVAIDTLANKILATIPIGQQPQALVYVPEAVPTGDGAANLMPLAEAGKASHLTLIAPEGSGSAARATVSVNSLGPLDLLQMAVSGLKPGQMYRLWLVTARTPPYGRKEELAMFKTNLAGAQVVQTVGPFRQILTSEREKTAEGTQQRFLLITPAERDAAELVEKTP
ncbi:MAG TPA: hypothetical protein VGU64_03740, partial [Terriglobales bacterium]|nr:hypothetical protein [Terriglobales bacterium]